jgi:hypothetical protein
VPNAVPCVELLGLVENTNVAAVPGTSVSVPKLVLPVTPETVLVPVFVMSPVASGVPAVGRTRTFCHVREFLSPLAVGAVMVTLIVEAVVVAAIAVPVARLLMLSPFAQGLVRQPTTTVGAVPPVSN